nr:cell wall hydrolase [uncultured Dorea sp.]
MISMKKKRVLRSVLATTICTVTIASVSTPVYSAPSSKELESTTSNLKGELNDLNSQLATLSKELDDTSSQIEELSAKVEKSKLDLASVQLDEEAQYDSMKDRIKFMYEGGTSSLLQILLTSENMGDFLNKAEYVATISDYDRSMLNQLQDVRKSVEKKQEELEAQQSKLSGLQKTLTSKREELNSKISSTSGELANYQAQLERAKAAEEALKIAQNNAVSGSLKAEDKKTETKTDTTATASNNNNNNNNNANKTTQPAQTTTNKNTTTTTKPNTTTNTTTNTGNNNTSSTPSSTSDVALFAAILQCEAGGYDGMLAVATVIMNRVASPAYPNNLHDVIYQSGQFAPTWNGSLNKVLKQGASSTAYQVAQDALAGARHSAVINCLQFRSASTGVSGVNVGGNVFF